MTTLESLRQSLGITLARWRLRKMHDDVIPFTTAVSSARRALLIMPLVRQDMLPVLKVVEMLKARFRAENITVVTGDYGLEIARMLPRSQFIRLLKQQITIVYHPRAHFLKSLAGGRYDLAIDLNLDLILPSGYICKASGARVRVGFCHAHADTFYNFQIKPDPTLGRKLIYERLVQCLEKF
jgi:ADP-heptose:LPS heptosyltransferase